MREVKRVGDGRVRVGVERSRVGVGWGEGGCESLNSGTFVYDR